MTDKAFIDQDVIRLRDMINHELRHTDIQDRRENLRFLADQLAQGKVISSHNIPAEIVTMGVWVRVRDMDSHADSSYTLVYPQDEDLEQGRLSVLSPLGMALIGRCANETLDWPAPGGPGRLKIMAVRRYAKSNKG